jgi:protocatechuate 3,4-dioxygenase beta subunit
MDRARVSTNRVLSLAAAGLIAATSLAPAAAQAATTCTATPAQTEGPYYTPGAPQRSNLAATTQGGTVLTLSGRVLDTTCKAVPNAVVDFWQADAAGNYDNNGFDLRGKVTTDANGRYTVTTVVPGLYTGRTAHIHVKVTPPNGTTLTTQLYFPNVASNARDNIYNAAMLVKDYKVANGKATATFDFVVRR